MTCLRLLLWLLLLCLMQLDYCSVTLLSLVVMHRVEGFASLLFVGVWWFFFFFFWEASTHDPNDAFLPTPSSAKADVANTTPSSSEHLINTFLIMKDNNNKAESSIGGKEREREGRTNSMVTHRKEKRREPNKGNDTVGNMGIAASLFG